VRISSLIGRVRVKQMAGAAVFASNIDAALPQ
jgi:hypothetical protein